ncbi:MAG TPA: hypothetical protein VIK78_19140 [Ruminiclostridium sp.]
MEFTYRNRKHIARIALVSIAFFLLLALNFKIWGGTYSVGDLEKIVINQSKEFEHCILITNDIKGNLKNAVQIKQLLSTGFNGKIIDCVLLSFTSFFGIYRSKLFCERRYTLVSLCVRMDE